MVPLICKLCTWFADRMVPVHDRVRERTEEATEPRVPAGGIPHVEKPDWEKRGGVVHHVEERHLLEVALEDDDHRVGELVGLGQVVHVKHVGEGLPFVAAPLAATEIVNEVAKQSATPATVASATVASAATKAAIKAITATIASPPPESLVRAPQCLRSHVRRQ